MTADGMSAAGESRPGNCADESRHCQERQKEPCSRGRANQHSRCRELPDPLLWYSVSPYFLLLEADLVGFLAGFAFALAIATPPSFAYAPGFHAKV
jgi:hypothetical protein